MNGPDKYFTVALGKKTEGVEQLVTGFEPDRVPQTAEQLGLIIDNRLSEIRNLLDERSPERQVPTRRPQKESLSKEAKFLLQIEELFKEFREANGIPANRMPNLAQIASVLRGKLDTLTLTPDETIELNDFITERLGRTEAEDITYVGEQNPELNQKGKQEAQEKIASGLADTWKKILEAAIRNTYIEQFPERVREEVSALATAQSMNQQRILLAKLTDRAARFPADRFRRFLRALIEEGVGDLKGRVISVEELQKFAAFVSERLPENETIPAGEIVSMMRTAAQEGGASIPKKSLSKVLEGFSENQRAVYELADMDKLFSADPAVDMILDGWERFTNIQRIHFLELIRGYYTSEPFKTEANSRRKLKDLAKKISDRLRTDKEVTKKEVQTLAALITIRVSEVYEFITEPDAEEMEAEQKEVAQESRADRVRGIYMRLSSPRAFLRPTLRILLADDMADVRAKLYEVMKETIIETGIVPGLPGLLGYEPTNIDLAALENVTGSNGMSTNKAGWEVLLKAANGSRRFRDRMQQMGE